ncbi:hypothetical protein GCM10027613_16620 [Microlunatus endophyticus]
MADGARGGATASGRMWAHDADPHAAVANTAVEWHGRDWAMIELGTDLPTVPLLLHEAFHAFWQPEWGWVTPAGGGDTSLSQPVGRAAVITELRAWGSYLETGDPAVGRGARSIRDWRLDQLSDAERERQDYFDLWEGIPEYSALRWDRTPTGEVADLARSGPRGGSWFRSLCYTTGPVLGYVLDHFDPGWRLGLRAAGSLSSMINSAVPPTESGAADLLDAYGYAETLHAEESAHVAWSIEDRVLRDRFATMLWIPNPGSVTFDPREVRHWDLGTFYRILSVHTDDLRLIVEDGAIVTANWSWIGLPAPESYDGSALTVTGPGWRMESMSPVHEHGVVLSSEAPE